MNNVRTPPVRSSFCSSWSMKKAEKYEGALGLSVFSLLSIDIAFKPTVGHDRGAREFEQLCANLNRKALFIR